MGQYGADYDRELRRLGLDPIDRKDVPAVQNDFNSIIDRLKSYRDQYQQGILDKNSYVSKIEDVMGDSGDKGSRRIQTYEQVLGQKNIQQALKPFGVDYIGRAPSGTVYTTFAPPQSDLNVQQPLPPGQIVPPGGTAAPPPIPAASDRGQIELEAQKELAQTLAGFKGIYQQQTTGLQPIYEQQVAGGRKNLLDLADLLTKTSEKQFGFDIPGIQNDLNAQHLLNTSAYPEALAREKAMLASQTSSILGQAAISGSQAALEKLGTGQTAALTRLGTGTESALAGSVGMQQSGLERQFSIEDYVREAALAKQLGANVTPQIAPYKASTGAGILGGAGAAAGPAALIASAHPWGAAALLAGGAAAGGASSLSWICTHLRKLGLASVKEVRKVHLKLIPTVLHHPEEWLHYWKNAPELIERADHRGIVWGEWKYSFVDNILKIEDREEAYQAYVGACFALCARYAPDLWDERFSEQVKTNA